jgi:hypothetical protein
MRIAGVLSFSFILLISFDLLGQEIIESTLKGSLYINSVPSEAEVYLDTVWIGVTPIQLSNISVGFHQVRIVYPSLKAWNATVRKETVYVAPNRVTNFNFDISTPMTLHSIPSGADIFLHRIKLGSTPLSYTLLKGPDTLWLQKDGFESIALVIGNLEATKSFVRLNPIFPTQSNALDVLQSNGKGWTNKTWLMVSSAAAMIVSGVLAAYFKEEANHNYNNYVLTHDPAMINSANRLDKQSSIALVITQISFGMLVFTLLSE